MSNEASKVPDRKKQQASVMTADGEQLANPAVETVKKRRRVERTPDQVARKRDQDREAQRLSRERTRRRIEEAEARLTETQNTAARHERELSDVKAERDEARQEAANLRLRLETTLAQLATAQSHLATAQAHLASMAQTLGTDKPQLHSPAATPSDSSHVSIVPGHLSQETLPHHSDFSYHARSPSRSDRLSIRSMIHRSASPTVTTKPEQLHVIPSRTYPPVVNTSLHNSLQSSKHSSPAPASASGTDIPILIPDTGEVGKPTILQPWQDPATMLPPNIGPTCPLDRILLITKNSRRELLSQGEPEDAVLGPRNPNLSSLPSLAEIIPNSGSREGARSRDPVAQMIAEVMVRFEAAIDGLPEQLAIGWVTHIVLRWLILPNSANWAALPPWMHPTPTQLSTPHPAWIDNLTWPGMRSILTSRYVDFPQDDFLYPWCKGLSVNWPHSPQEAIVVDEKSGLTSISPAFERHIRDLGNWTLDREFEGNYPELRGTYRLGERNALVKKV